MQKTCVYICIFDVLYIMINYLKYASNIFDVDNKLHLWTSQTEQTVATMTSHVTCCGVNEIAISIWANSHSQMWHSS